MDSEGNIRSTIKVEMRMMMMFTRLLSTRIVASRWRGARSESGRCNNSNAREAAAELLLFFRFSNSSMSAGVRLKNATSEPETRALAIKSNAMQMEGIMPPLCPSSTASNKARIDEFKGVDSVQQCRLMSALKWQIVRAWCRCSNRLWRSRLAFVLIVDRRVLGRLRRRSCCA